MHEQERQFIQPAHLWWLLLIVVSLGAGITMLFVNPLLLFAVVILIANVVIIIKYPMWGLLSYLIIFLLRPGELYPALAPLRLELLTGAFVLMTIVIREKVLTGRVTLPSDKITLSLVAFLVVMALTIFTSYEKTFTKETCVNFVKLLIFYYLIISLLTDRRKFIIFMSVFYLLIAYIAFDAFKVYLGGGFVHAMGVDRMRGSTSAGGDPNTLANTLATTIPIVVASAFYFRNRIIKIGLLTLILGMSSLIVITASRGGMIAFLGILIGAFIFSNRKAVMLAVIIILLPLGWMLLPDQYKARYETLTDIEDIDQTSSGRWEIWSAGLKMIYSRPILGVGAGAFSAANGSGDFGRSQYMRAHNLYIQLMATTGVVGFVVWLGFFIGGLLKKLRWLARKARDSDDHHWIIIFSKSFVISMIALFISGVFGHSLYRYTWYMIAGLTVTMAMVFQRELEERRGHRETGKGVKAV
ncbi:MAG: O-antigen ligase family protein [Candidatus Zixiibacteriota bacterium]|nr:MAG: O-antigen ligase family protein [candidate division Zixibacteria bacterium]